MITVCEPVQKICQNSAFWIEQNSMRSRDKKKSVVPPFSGYFTWVESDKESSPVVGKILRSGA